MLILKECGSLNITGKGKIFVVNKYNSPEIEDVKIGDIVEINNKQWKIIDIEYYMKLLDPPIPGDDYGLIVKEYNNGNYSL